MKNPIVIGSTVLLAAAMLAAAAPLAHADDVRVVATVPFEFIVGDVRLPAGAYTVQTMENNPDVVEIRGADRRGVAFAITIPDESGAAGGDTGLVFEKFENQYFLSKIVSSDGDRWEIGLTPARMEREIADAR